MRNREITIVGGIYKITNINTGHFYIGSAKYIKSRWARHRMQLRKGNHDNRHLQNSWNKNGEESFLFEVIEHVIDTSKLIEREQYFIDLLNPKYNVLKVAGSSIGLKHSQETKEKLRAIFKGRSPSNKGVPRSEETKLLLKKAWEKRRLKPMSEETKKKISEGLKGRIFSDQHKKNLTGIKQSDETIQKRVSKLKGQKRTDEIKKKLSDIQKVLIKDRKRDSIGRILPTVK